MNITVAASSTKDLEHELQLDGHTLDRRPAQGARWWFVFDRWLAVTDVADEQDEFVMA